MFYISILLTTLFFTIGELFLKTARIISRCYGIFQVLCRSEPKWKSLVLGKESRNFNETGTENPYNIYIYIAMMDPQTCCHVAYKPIHIRQL